MIAHSLSANLVYGEGKRKHYSIDTDKSVITWATPTSYTLVYNNKKKIFFLFLSASSGLNSTLFRDS